MTESTQPTEPRAKTNSSNITWLILCIIVRISARLDTEKNNITSELTQISDIITLAKTNDERRTLLEALMPNLNTEEREQMQKMFLEVLKSIEIGNKYGAKRIRRISL